VVAVVLVVVVVVVVAAAARVVAGVATFRLFGGLREILFHPHVRTVPIQGSLSAANPPPILGLSSGHRAS
jgi:hypothetical protein